MKLSDIANQTWVECLQSDYDGDAVVASGYTSDLLSDVMANAPDGCLLITIQAHNNAVAVASLAGAVGILICNDRPVPEDMIESTRREGIALFRTTRNQFQASCMFGQLIEA